MGSRKASTVLAIETRKLYIYGDWNCKSYFTAITTLEMVDRKEGE
jgi:hypothetical protein